MTSALGLLQLTEWLGEVESLCKEVGAFQMQHWQRVKSQDIADKGLKLPAGCYVVQVGKRKFARVTVK